MTFDDGFGDAVRYGAPVLKHFGFAATFFVVAGLIGGSSAWLATERGFELPLAGWEALSELRAAGFEIGSHAVSHPHLDRLSDEECRSELVEARTILQQRLGGAVEHLAYPFGHWNERVRLLASEAGYATACTTGIGLATRSNHPLSLPRVPVLGTETLSLFAWRLRFAHAPRELIRGLIAQSRLVPHAGVASASKP
jgi:peptidoglycan/xylan/chitin deacetylase (PgdA/CDA1 family)